VNRDRATAEGEQPLTTLLHLEQRALSAVTPEVLGFTIVNETLSLVPYRQAAFFVTTANGKRRLTTASGLVSVAEDSPYAVWLGRLVQTFPSEPGCHRLNFADASSDIVDGWREWLPDHLLATPLAGPDGREVGMVMYAREEAWGERETNLLDRLHQTYSYCLWSMTKRRCGLGRMLAGMPRSRWRWALPLLLVVLLIPVRMTALAPAEVVALDAMAVAAPQDGVVSKIYVQPNALVEKGDALFSLDDTELIHRREVALKELAIARADAFLAEQRAFDNLKSKGDLAAAMGKVREKEAELAAVEALLERVTVRAEHDGIAVFADPNDWLGRPVQTGERIMQLADPRDLGVLIWLPVPDALNLEPGAPVRLFLHTQPLSPLGATVVQTSYQPVTSPEGISAYRLRARFEKGVTQPRIGLRGTASVSGDWALLGYYLFRRPIAALREWSGL
jgi:hypothetical protein